MAIRRFLHIQHLVLACAVLVFALMPLAGARAGDSIYGTIVAVKRSNLFTLDYGAGRYDVQIVGVEVARDVQNTRAAELFAAKLVLNKKARLRFYSRGPNGEMQGRLLVDDRATGFRDVGLELVRSGLVLRRRNFDYTYGEMSKAEREAQGGRRGLWLKTRPQ